jgi:hypothetical protein
MHESKCLHSPWKTRYFVDTEFTDFIDCQLISVAIVGEDGREFYGERATSIHRHAATSCGRLCYRNSAESLVAQCPPRNYATS